MYGGIPYSDNLVRTSLLPPSLPFPPCHPLASFSIISPFILSHHAWSQEYRVARFSRVNGHLDRVLCVRAVAVTVVTRNLDLFQKEGICGE